MLLWYEYITGVVPESFSVCVPFLITILRQQFKYQYVSSERDTNRNWTCYRFDGKKRSINGSQWNALSLPDMNAESKLSLSCPEIIQICTKLLQGSFSLQNFKGLTFEL